MIWTFYSLCLLCSPLAIPALSFFKVTIPTQHWDINLDLIASQGLSWNRRWWPLCAPLDGPSGPKNASPAKRNGINLLFRNSTQLKRTSLQEEVTSPVPTLKGHLRFRVPLHAWLKPLLWKHPTSPSAYSCFLPFSTDVAPENTPQYISSTWISISEDLTSARAFPTLGIRNPPTWVSRYPCIFHHCVHILIANSFLYLPIKIISFLTAGITSYSPLCPHYQEHMRRSRTSSEKNASINGKL